MTRRLIALAFVIGAALLATGAQAAGWGVGGFGGVSIPIAQDDAASGPVFGGHVKFSLGMVSVEPNLTYFKNGDYEVDEAPGETFESGKVTSFGVNVLLGAGAPMGFRFYPFLGAKYYDYQQDLPGFSDSQLGLDGGVGFEFGAGTAIGIDVRASLEVMPLEDEGSRKWVHVRGGLNYYFGLR